MAGENLKPKLKKLLEENLKINKFIEAIYDYLYKKSKVNCPFETEELNELFGKVCKCCSLDGVDMDEVESSMNLFQRLSQKIAFEVGFYTAVERLYKHEKYVY